MSRNILVNAIAPGKPRRNHTFFQPEKLKNLGSGPMDTPFFYPRTSFDNLHSFKTEIDSPAEESEDAVAFHKSSAAQGRLTKIEDIVPIVDMLVSGQHWINGQVIVYSMPYRRLINLTHCFFLDYLCQWRVRGFISSLCDQVADFNYRYTSKT